MVPAGSLVGDEKPFTEMVYGLVSGVAYGLTSPVVGHPFDTVKTNMQVKPQYKGKSMIFVFKDMISSSGWRSIYKGFLPPLLGSAAYRGVQFSAYSGAYSYAESIPLLASPIPFMGGLHPSVIVGAIAGALARSSIESPLDYMKVRSQTGQSFLLNPPSSPPANFKQILPHLTPKQLLHLYSGFVPTFLRTAFLFTAFFSLVDSSVRHIPDIINAPTYGPFFKGGICATSAWGFAFPLETVKSVVQADKKFEGKGTLTAMRTIVKEDGVLSLYRGFSAGASRSFFANGASMMVYQMFQKNLRSKE